MVSRPLALPLPVRVATGARGRPVALDGVGVESIREEWVVDDRWWTDRPLRRRYFELALADGRCLVVFRDLLGGGWASQAG